MEPLPVIFSEAASTDLENIAAYILSNTQSVATLVKYMARLEARCLRIGNAPFGGIAREELGPGIRMAVFERNVTILYVVEESAVVIANVFSGGRDYETLFDHRGNLPPEDPA